MIYRAIGKAAVKGFTVFVWRRYRRQIRIAAGLAVAAMGLAGYLASRNVPEG